MINVDILDLESGEVRTYNQNVDWNGSFIWEEGNFACDCNRGNFFARAGGEFDLDSPCGDERFVVLEIRSDEGERLYGEERQK